MTPASVATAALWLGIYSTVISTTVGLLSLYGEIFQRIKVGATEDFFVGMDDGRVIRMSQTAVDDFEPPEAALRPILTVRVLNRGRRAVQVRTISKAYWTKTGRHVFDELFQALPAVVEPGQSQDFTLGAQRQYEHGSLGQISRFYVVDGADRVHPLRERWIQRIENVLWRRLAIRRQRRHKRQR